MLETLQGGEGPAAEAVSSCQAQSVVGRDLFLKRSDAHQVAGVLVVAPEAALRRDKNACVSARATSAAAASRETGARGRHASR